MKKFSGDILTDTDSQRNFHWISATLTDSNLEEPRTRAGRTQHVPWSSPCPYQLPAASRPVVWPESDRTVRQCAARRTDGSFSGRALVSTCVDTGLLRFVEASSSSLPVSWQKHLKSNSSWILNLGTRRFQAIYIYYMYLHLSVFKDLPLCNIEWMKRCLGRNTNHVIDLGEGGSF